MLGSARHPDHRRFVRPVRRGYTLAEVMVVVVILGVLATLAVVGLRWIVEDAEEVAFTEQLRRMATASEIYRLKTGDWPADAAPGEMPMGLAEYTSASDWAAPTPIGGQWVYSSNVGGGAGGGGGSPGVGVSFEGDGINSNDEVLQLRIAAAVQRIDEEIDDGNLDTGGFRRVGEASFYMILN